LSIRAEPFEQIIAQRMDGMFRRINDLICKRPNARHCCSFGTNCGQQPLTVIGGMWSARFAEAPL